MICLICNKEFKHLGSHIYHKHKMFAREYKMMFELDLGFPLIDDSVRKKQQIGWKRNEKRNLKNLEKGKKYRFKKGHIGKKLYTSRQSKERFIDNLKKDKSGICPVCGMKAKHISSHLYNKGTK